MCRLLGIVASQPVDFRVLLAERPRCLAALAEEHRDGWGLASFSAGQWHVHKGASAASHAAGFHRRARALRGEMLVSHVRKRTVGRTRIANSHPFVEGRWVFAHNGTIEDRAWLAEQVSAARRAEIHGDTDSELFFAFLLTRFDEAGLTANDASVDHATLDLLVASIAAECRARTRFGSFNFLLSNGNGVYVHRFGRSLYVLERGARDHDPNRRAHAVFVASEPMTDEAWRELDDATLLRVDGGSTPRVTVIA